MPEAILAVEETQAGRLGELSLSDFEGKGSGADLAGSCGKAIADELMVGGETLDDEIVISGNGKSCGGDTEDLFVGSECGFLLKDGILVEVDRSESNGKDSGLEAYESGLLDGQGCDSADQGISRPCFNGDELSDESLNVQAGD